MDGNRTWMFCGQCCLALPVALWRLVSWMVLWVWKRACWCVCGWLALEFFSSKLQVEQRFPMSAFSATCLAVNAHLGCKVPSEGWKGCPLQDSGIFLCWPLWILHCSHCKLNSFCCIWNLDEGLTQLYHNSVLWEQMSPSPAISRSLLDPHKMEGYPAGHRPPLIGKPCFLWKQMPGPYLNRQACSLTSVSFCTAWVISASLWIFCSVSS